MTFTEYFGIIVRTHGVDGSVVVGETAGLSPTLQPGDTIGIGFSREHARPRVLEAALLSPERIVLRLRGFSTKEEAEELIDNAVYLASEQAGTKDKERFTIGAVEGCNVFNEDGAALGKITEVMLLPANDVWVLTQPDGQTIPLPVIDDVIKSIDTENRRIVVALIDGLDQVDVNSPEDHDA